LYICTSTVTNDEHYFSLTVEKMRLQKKNEDLQNKVTLTEKQGRKRRKKKKRISNGISS